ncbi:MAG: N-acetylmuramoyl-L-alanine amidase [Deferribacterales bacterium]|nr:N-acetylmuramoyl-L-alanine amidase [Deferribacterales bacterium]
MREIKYIIIHCSATKKNHHITVKDIDLWHKQQGWQGCGYHYVIGRNGFIEKGRDENVAGAHCKGQNRVSIGVCLAGGIDENGNAEANFTETQFNALQDLVEQLLLRYPTAKVLGHRDFDKSKECPCFDVAKWWDNVSMGDKGIFYKMLEDENKFNLR